MSNRILENLPSPTRKNLSIFGIAMAVIFAALGFLEPILFGVAALFLIPTLVAPSLLKAPYFCWMVLGYLLHAVVLRIILVLLFYLAFVPIGWLLRLTGKDPLERNVVEGSNWKRFRPDGRGTKRYHSQFTIE